MGTGRKYGLKEAVLDLTKANADDSAEMMGLLREGHKVISDLGS